jgi:hypothetical protein
MDKLPTTEIKRRCGHVEQIACDPASPQARWAKRCNCLTCTPTWRIVMRCECVINYERTLQDNQFTRSNIAYTICTPCSM